VIGDLTGLPELPEQRDALVVMDERLVDVAFARAQVAEQHRALGFDGALARAARMLEHGPHLELRPFVQAEVDVDVREVVLGLRFGREAPCPERELRRALVVLGRARRLSEQKQQAAQVHGEVRHVAYIAELACDLEALRHLVARADEVADAPARYGQRRARGGFVAGGARLTRKTHGLLEIGAREVVLAAVARGHAAGAQQLGAHDQVGGAR
jgi:hypothetical protein